MAAGLHGTGEPLGIGDVFHWVLGLSKGDAEEVRKRARQAIAYVRAMPDDHAALLASLFEHAADIRAKL